MPGKILPEEVRMDQLDWKTNRVKLPTVVMLEGDGNQGFAWPNSMEYLDRDSVLGLLKSGADVRVHCDGRALAYKQKPASTDYIKCSSFCERLGDEELEGMDFGGRIMSVVIFETPGGLLKVGYTSDGRLMESMGEGGLPIGGANCKIKPQIKGVYLAPALDALAVQVELPEGYGLCQETYEPAPGKGAVQYRGCFRRKLVI
jgi:hypothetical protein